MPGSTAHQTSCTRMRPLWRGTRDLVEEGLDRELGVAGADGAPEAHVVAPLLTEELVALDDGQVLLHLIRRVFRRRFPI